MILVCPGCSVKYGVEPDAIPAGGRKVECSRCGWVWWAEPPVPPVRRSTVPERTEARDPGQSGLSYRTHTEMAAGPLEPRFALSADVSQEPPTTMTAPGGKADVRKARTAQRQRAEAPGPTVPATPMADDSPRTARADMEDRPAEGARLRARLSMTPPALAPEPTQDTQQEESPPPPLPPVRADGLHTRPDERRDGGSLIGWLAFIGTLALLLSLGFVYQAELLEWFTVLKTRLMPGN